MHKKIIVILSALILINQISIAQSPGGVNANLTFWLKANTTTPANITYNATNNVSNWKSDVGTYQVSQNTVSKRPVFFNNTAGTGIFNYNPYIQFDRTATTNLNSTSLTPNLLGTTGSIFMICNKYISAVNGSLLTYYSSSTTRFQIKPSFRVQNGVSGIGYKFDLNTLPGTIINYPDESAFILASTGTGLTSKARRNATDFGPSTGNSSTFFPAIVAGLNINGNGPTAEFTNFGLAEVIMFNSTLTGINLAKVESYLAIKYGITFDELANQSTNYYASDATVVWDKTANVGYNANITGIARDDASGLIQKQSKSVNNNGLVSVFNTNTNGVFPVMNDSNSTTIPVDKTFFMFGDNDDDTTINVCIRNGHMARMKRVWKVKETGSFGNITLALENNVLPMAKTLLVSNNPTFPDNATTVYNLNTGTKKYFSIDLASDQYFTFATDSTALPQYQSSPICSGANGTAVITNPKPGAIYKWYNQPIGGTIVNTGISITATNITNSITYYVETTTPANCVLASRVPITIQVTPTPVAPTVTSPVELCLNATASPLTAIGTNLLWYTTATGGTGTTVAPTPSTATIGTTTYYVSQSSANGCVGLRSAIVASVRPLPTVSAGADKLIITGDNTTLDGSAQNYVSYAWQPATSGITLTPVVAPITTTTYTLTATNNFGCSSKDDVLVTVLPYCVKVMNAFSPNGDGINDRWVVTGGGNCTNLITAKVYNRYGALVYENKNYLNDWDGKYKGKLLADATYYYILTFYFINGKAITVKGDVSI
ncbi:MAG: gliding motility-associated C-terminal domain-containing protein, partial [Ferruginibacter sp.]|nr:gliding motility-associated C-terminal domain-containing protein [Ferruginibacter sp.]